mmetsp:Transcript_146781/g.468972  ORF Transcript_146781/g.468972 Transcript_146781/m.468972 type:complete len:252 (+) Transcript_146781:508-1263(+)
MRRSRAETASKMRAAAEAVAFEAFEAFPPPPRPSLVVEVDLEGGLKASTAAPPPPPSPPRASARMSSSAPDANAASRPVASLFRKSPTSAVRGPGSGTFLAKFTSAKACSSWPSSKPLKKASQTRSRICSTLSELPSRASAAPGATAAPGAPAAAAGAAADVSAGSLAAAILSMTRKRLPSSTEATKVFMAIPRMSSMSWLSSATLCSAITSANALSRSPFIDAFIKMSPIWCRSSVHGAALGPCCSDSRT